MPRKFTKNFSEFIHESLNEQAIGQSAEQFLQEFKEVIDLCSNLQQITYPSDIHGHSSSVIQLEAPGKNVFHAVDKATAFAQVADGLTDLADYYTKNEKTVSFYVWNIRANGMKYRELEKMLGQVSGGATEQHINLSTLLQLIESQPDIAEKIETIGISLDSQQARGFAKAMSDGEFGKLD